MCELCSKLTIEASDIVLVSSVVFFCLFVFSFVLFLFFADFEHVSARWNSSLP